MFGALVHEAGTSEQRRLDHSFNFSLLVTNVKMALVSLVENWVLYSINV